MKLFVFLLTVFSIQFANANVQSLIPAGYELAKTYAQFGEYGDPEASKGSVVEFDFNNDGRKDVAMLVEKRVCSGSVSGTECVNDFWGWSAEDRTLLVFFKTAKGYDLILETKNGVLGDGEGGVASRDPLMSFTVNSKGTLHLSYWGGSWKS